MKRTDALPSPPLTGTVALPEVAAKLTVILPLKFPAVAGLKLTVTFCVDPAAIVPLQFPLKPAG